MSTIITQQVERKPIYCRNEGCNVEITFRPGMKSKSGKSIPIERSSGLKHNCKFSPYVLKQSSETSFTSQAQIGSTVVGETKQPIKQVEQQATNTLLHEILFEIGGN